MYRENKLLITTLSLACLFYLTKYKNLLKQCKLIVLFCSMKRNSEILNLESLTNLVRLGVSVIIIMWLDYNVQCVS